MARAPFQVLVFPYRRLADGEIVYALLKRADKGYWQSIAGGGEEGESAIQAARRETFEETGISTGAEFLPLQTVESIPVTEFANSYLWGEETFVIPQYCFGVLSPSAEITISHEHTRYSWFSFSEAYKRLVFTGNRTALWELDRRLRGTGPRGEAQAAETDLKIQPLTFLKLGGSLITDKTRPHTAQMGVITRLAEEIAIAHREQPDLHLVIGHGSGSFGHVPAKKYGTRQGVRNAHEWRGFYEVWHEANQLNHMVIDALNAAGLPAISLPPSAQVITRDGEIVEWNITPLIAALGHDLLPVVYGDVVLDETLGGTILSTEDLFVYLATKLRPARLFLAGLEEGVWEDYPGCTRLAKQITQNNLEKIELALGGSTGTDVTGGMASKVHQMVDLVKAVPGLQACIFSGAIPGNLQHALTGTPLGTLISQ